NRDREHAAHPLERAEAVLGVELRDHFRVARRVERTPRGMQFVAQLDVVVDLAVLHDGDAAVDGDRLMTTGDVDDAETRRRQRRRTIDGEPGVVGPAMPERGDHPREPRRVSRPPGQRDETSDSTHRGAIPVTSASSSTTYCATRSPDRPSMNWHCSATT